MIVYTRFVTGSGVCKSESIDMPFNSLSGLAQHRIVHVCNPLLELPITYLNNDTYLRKRILFRIGSLT